jgi:hypothetical protein
VWALIEFSRLKFSEYRFSPKEIAAAAPPIQLNAGIWDMTAARTPAEEIAVRNICAILILVARF